jgi:hypothetical protein
MKELLDKISSYNLFNYLFPGILFAVIADGVTSAKLLQHDLVVGVFVYYFLGAVVSRVGSILIEPILRWIGFVRFMDYADFVSAAKSDPKLEILSETNNMYRTLSGLFLLIGILAAYDFAAASYPWLHKAASAICIVALFMLFLISYRKQSTYIAMRIRAQKPQG